MARVIANGLTGLALVVAALIPMTRSLEATEIVADEPLDLYSGAVFSENGDYALFGIYEGGSTSLEFWWQGAGDAYGVWASTYDGSFGGSPGYHQNQWGSVDISGYWLMQSDGNFVIYHSSPLFGARWSTSTHGNPGSRMNVQNDGNLVVYSSTDAVLWAIF